MDISEKINNLPEDLQDFFCSAKPRIILEKVCFLYAIREEDMGKVTDLVSGIFLKDIALGELPIKIMQNLRVANNIAYGMAWEMNKEMFGLFADYFRDAGQLLAQWEPLKCAPLVSEEKARRRLLDLEPWIEEEEKERAQEQKAQQEEERKEQLMLETLPFSEALKKYMRLGEQSITSNMIKLKYFPAPVRPSIKNWMADYQDFAGPGRHSAVERGNYIFHTENAKKLTPLERQKITYLLRLIDEDLAVKVDIQAQNLIFDLEQQDLRTPAGFKPQERGVDRGETAVPAGLPGKSFATSFAPVQKPFPVQTEIPGGNLASQQQTLKAVVQKNVQSSASNTPSQGAGTESRFSNMAPFGKTVNPLNLNRGIVQPVAAAKPAVSSVSQSQRTNVYPQNKIAQSGNVVNLSAANKTNNVVLGKNTVVIKGAPANVMGNNRIQTAPLQVKPTDKTGNLYDKEARVQLETRKYFEKVEEQQKMALRDSENEKANERVIEEAIASKVVQPAPKQAENLPAGGKVSFSSPQTFTPPKSAPPIRSPYRITPRGYEYNQADKNS